jgi:hypothetical protein
MYESSVIIKVLLASICRNNQIHSPAKVIIIAAAFQKCLISNHIIFVITIKSGLRHLTISIIKNDLDFLNIVLENNKPSIKVIIPLNTIKPIKPTQPH